MPEAWITVLSCRSRNISQKGRNRLRRSKKVSYKHWGFRHRHTRDSQVWQHCVVIPLAKRIAGTTGKVAKAKECVVPRQRTEENSIGFTLSFVQMQCNCKCNSLVTSFPSHQFSIFTHTHSVHFSAFSLHNPPCVTSHQHMPHHGYNAVAGQCGAGSHLLRANRHQLPTK
jgi:hypothetical protein